jgi:hypothetical protein
MGGQIGVLLTVRAVGQLDDIADADVNNTQEALILLLELFLVEDLYSKNAVLTGLAVYRSQYPSRSVGIQFNSLEERTNQSSHSSTD